ncbi:MAG: DUF2846 domain-containing protein [Bacteroidetes bacterium]|nr:DUF2846 domain-containing protein [Bacteroidota bacterium]
MTTEGKAKVYVLRPSRLGFAMGVKVFCNDKLIGKTKGGKFLEWELDPGTYTILSKAENAATIELNVEAGKEYFLKQIIFPGFWRARNKIEVVEEAQARQDIQTCKPVKNQAKYN